MLATPDREAAPPRPPLRWTHHAGPGAPADEPPPRDIGGRYVIQQLLGRGGMASVYLGRDRRLKRQIAIKILRRGIEVERFEREAVILADLRHDHIAEVHDSGLLEDGRPYFVTQYLDGVNLGRLLAVAPLPWEVVLEIGLQVASVLHAVHQRGVIHRDVKPENIMLLRPVKGELSVKLVDFGVARLTTRWDEVAQRDTPPKERHRTREGLALGTDGYISLAASMGQLTPEADVFALGVTLFKLCTGHHPYEKDLEAIHQRGIAPDFAQVILGAIDFDPGREIGNAEALHSALARVAARQSMDALACERKAYLARVFFRDEPMQQSKPAVVPDAPTAAPMVDPVVRPRDDAAEPVPHAARPRPIAPRTREELRAWAGRVLNDRFELESVLGDGGAAVVFDAWDMHFRQRAAVKVLLPEQADDPAALQRFEHEARVLMKVRQEHLVAAFDRGTTPEGLHYLALEHLDGAHLGKVRGAAWLHWPTVLEIGAQAAKALDALHRAGVLHRDVVPTNLVWVRDSRRPVHVKLIDASHCKLLPAWYDRERRDSTRPRDRLLTREGLIFGDRRFRPPEAGLRPPHPREDIFGLGVTLYLLLTGKYPYPGGMPVLGQPLIDPVPIAEANPAAAVPAELAQLVHDAIQLDPDLRPESIEDFFDQWMGAAEALDPNAFHDYVLTGGIKFADCAEAKQVPTGAIRHPDWDRLRPAVVHHHNLERSHRAAADPPAPIPVPSQEPPRPPAEPPLALPVSPGPDGPRKDVQKSQVPRARAPFRSLLSHTAVAAGAVAVLALAFGVPSLGDHGGVTSDPGPAMMAAPPRSPPTPGPPLQPAVSPGTPEPSDTDRLRDALQAGCPNLHGSLRLTLQIDEHQPRVLRVDSRPLDVEGRRDHRCIQENLTTVRLAFRSTPTQLFVIKLPSP